MYNNKTLPPNRFNVVNGIISELLPIWEDSENCHYEFGDDCWRAALADIIYSNPETFKALMSHFYKGKLHRSLRENKDNCSRDQLIMFITALVIRDKELGKVYASKLKKWRISKRYTMTPSLYYWVKFVSDPNEKNLRLFHKWFKLELQPTLWISRKILRYYNVPKTINEKEHPAVRYKGLKHLLISLTYPSFAVHLTSWQLYVIKSMGFEIPLDIKNDLTLFIKEFLPQNYLCLKLLGENVNLIEVYKEFKPHNDFWWQRSSISDIYMRELTPKESIGNNIDKDILLVKL
jgi:hypothetical protein